VPNFLAEVRPKWEFSRALKVFHSEFKAKGIQFHYAMDHSFDDLEVDYVVADLNRMKQGKINIAAAHGSTDENSAGQPNHECD
jgi:hypothetical protein